ncbi:hypothetical protein [Pleionea sp. CnH1-48]|uniref:hypothetical protein n=1 Tax=Pleionea sp. CnH1-48 TaxID=2954494 RepID=UPI00209708FE|nr:hypothetical protein [Pleionea sp. CnH1-48]MCO7225988.1 hypothetical protein [Pleionea sp. CnH1-48]
MTTLKQKLATALGIWFVNVLVALLFMRFSPVCYSYVDESYTSISGILILALQVPFYWIFGFIVFVFIFPMSLMALLSDLSLIEKDKGFIAQLAYVFMTFAISLFGLYKWRVLSSRQKWGIVLIVSLLINPIFLESFFLSMSV